MIPLFIAGGVAAARGGAGIAQRLLLVTVATWFLVFALRLRANATETANANHALSDLRTNSPVFKTVWHRARWAVLR
jgi:hypothetical protein